MVDGPLPGCHRSGGKHKARHDVGSKGGPDVVCRGRVGVGAPPEHLAEDREALRAMQLRVAQGCHEGADEWHRWRSWSQPTLLTTTPVQWMQTARVSTVEQSHTRGPVELVPTQSQKVHPQGLKIERNVSRGLHGVRVYADPTGVPDAAAQKGHHPGHVLDGGSGGGSRRSSPATGPQSRCSPASGRRVPCGPGVVPARGERGPRRPHDRGRPRVHTGCADLGGWQGTGW